MFEHLEVLYDAPLLVGESPLWDELFHKLYFVDIRGRCYYTMEGLSGQSTKIDVPQLLGCMALCQSGDVFLGMEDAVYCRKADGSIVPAHRPITIKGERFNDGKVGPDGCYYVGTAGANFSGAFYRLQNGELTELFDGCGCSNGLDWSADGNRMYYCDSPAQKIESFAFSCQEHTVSCRQLLTPIEKSLGTGDGMAIDAKGNLWVAVWGGSCVLHIETATGHVLEKIPVPVKQVSSCCFAGDDMRDLIITTAAVRTDLSEEPLAGRVFRYRTDVAGVPINRYVGGDTNE